MRAAAILLAAGRGERMEAEQPKAFIELGGRTLLERSVATAQGCPEIDGFVVVAPAGHEARARSLAGSAKVVEVVTGGETRQASVRRGLEALPGGFDTVICHDVARPLAVPALFSMVLPVSDPWDGVIPVVAVVDTLKRIEGQAVLETVDRGGLAGAQTPQAFRRSALEAAHRDAEAAGIDASDDAALLERSGFRVRVTEGDPLNIKITRKRDLETAEALLRLRHG
jgi:2-C-methyl-D-erythritol 4-phosphate cytidylyltransferase / 2-C-methyl-D-erythritol 2,4-cyclodiphosphate synthase